MSAQPFWYHEYLSHGRWCPATTDHQPTIKNDRLIRGGTQGPRVRNVQVVPRHLEHLALDEIQEAMARARHPATGVAE